MDDKNIIALFFKRSELAIEETKKKYDNYCLYIANNILHSKLDAEECVSDTYIIAWDTIPPKEPENFATYLGKITRNISINRIVHDSAKKRSKNMTAVFDEAEDLIPDPNSLNDLSSQIHLKDAINSFVSSLNEETRVVFVRRYWYMSSVSDIASDYGYSESKVKIMLMRTRNKFKSYLEKEGINI